MVAVHTLVILLVFVKVQALLTDAFVLKVVEAALHSVWIQNQHIAAL